MPAQNSIRSMVPTAPARWGLLSSNAVGRFCTPLIAVTVLALGIGCVGAENDGSGVTDGDVLTPGQLTVTVAAAREAEVGPVAPPDGQTHVILEVAVANGLDSSHLVGPVVFWVLGSDGLERIASPLTNLLPTGCPSDAMLSRGASTRCELVFAVPSALALDTLLYRDGVTSVDAEMPPVQACDRCDGRCTDLENDPANCGECNRAAPLSECIDSEIICDDENALACQSGPETLSCVVPTTPEHCGNCGNACDALSGNSGECRDGSCLYRAANFFGPCSSTCSQFGLSCAFSEQCGNEGACNATQTQGCFLTCYCEE